jgi:PST family polysaccharide transporter
MKLFRDLTVLAGGQLISKVLGFLAFAWLARALDPINYGAVEYIVGLAAFFALLVDGGMGVVGTRRTVRDPQELPLLAFQIPVARLLLVLVGVPIMAAIAIVTTSATVPQALVWLFAASLLTVPWRQQWLFQATGRMAAVANGEIVRMAVFAAGIWIFVRAPSDVLAVGLAELCAVAAMTALCIVMQQREVTPFRLTGSFSGFGALVREGAAVGSSNFVWALAQSVPLFLIASLTGGVETAWFAGAARIVASLGQFGNLYHFNLYPAVSRAHASGDGTLGRLQSHSMRATAWGGVFIALVLTVFALPLVKLTLGGKLLAAAPLLQVMAWILPIALWSGHSRNALAAAGEQKKVLYSQLIGLAATVAACVGLGHVYGGIGYAAGSLAGAVVVWAVSHWFARTQGCVPPPFRLTVLPLALAAVIVLLVEHQSFGFWASALVVSAFPLLAPVLDRALLGDIFELGKARQREESVQPEPGGQLS